LTLPVQGGRRAYSKVKVMVVSSTFRDPSRLEPRDTGSSGIQRSLQIGAAACEACLAAAAVLLDVLIPSLVMLAMAAVSLTVRRRGLGSLGLRRVREPARLMLKMLAVAVVWSLVQLSLTIPIANHVSGQKQDLSAFADLEGNVGLLVLLLVLGWTLGAFAEELAYRGYLQTRLTQAFGPGRFAVWAAVLIASVLFGAAHSEQGAIGVLVVTLDGIVFSVVRNHYRTVWASVLAHGFNNTLGFLTFFLIGPVYGFW
jgi:membrane protease YdiL (CAAX protease family)